MTVFKLFLRTGNVDGRGQNSVVRKDGHPLGEHFGESPAYVVAAMLDVGAVQGHVARAELGDQRRGAVEHLHVARLRRQLDRVGELLEEDAFRGDEADAELIWGFSHDALSGRSVECEKQVRSVECEV